MNALLLRRHWVAGALALFIAILIALPPLWGKIRSGVSLNDPVNIRIADEFFYFARIRDVFDGYPLSGNPYTWEGKADPPGQPVFLGEYLTAEAIRLMGLDVVAGNVVLDAILPAAAVLLTYACFLVLTSRRLFAILGTAVLFLFAFPTDFARTVSPQTNFLFWLSEFLILHALLTRDPAPPRRRALILAAAVNFGLLFYIYPYYWMFYAAFFAIAAVGALAMGDGVRARAIGWVAGGGVIVALPYFWMLARAAMRPEYTETLRRIGMIETHFPSGAAIIVPAAVLLWRGVLRWEQRMAFLVAGALAAVVSVNQHLLTGRNFEFSSHFYMLALFWFSLFGAYLAGGLAKERTGWSRSLSAAAGALAIALVGYAIASAVPPQYMSARAELRRYLPLFKWLNANTAQDSVIYAPDEISNLAPIYTANNVFFSSWSRVTLMSDREVLDRAALSAYGKPVDAEGSVKEVFGTQYLNIALHTRQENKVRRLLGLEPKPAVMAPPEALAAIRQRWAEVRARDLYVQLQPYRVDYVVFDRARADSLKPPPGEKLYDQGDFAVWRLHPAPAASPGSSGAGKSDNLKIRWEPSFTP